MFVSGFSAAAINFGLNVAAVGVTLPLQINADLISLNGSAFPPALYNSGNADVTMSATSPSFQRVASPSAARTITLPSAGIKAGYQMRLVVSGATETNFVKLQSSGGNEVDRIGGDGFIDVVALQDAPTSAAHWYVLGVEETTTQTNSWSLANTSGTYTLRVSRVGKIGHITLPNINTGATVTNAAAGMNLGTIPARFSVGSGITASTTAVRVSGNGGLVAIDGLFYLNEATMSVFRDALGTGFPSGWNFNTIPADRFTFTYRIA